jgi:nicotinamide-nucleotide amidase
MNLYRIALVSIGNEVLSGDTLNTNAAWIGRRCAAIGALVTEQRTVPDERAAIIEAVSALRTRADLVVTTGGLGPTHDDVTVAALCELFGDKLIVHEPTLEYLERKAALRGGEATERVRSQALVPSSAIVLPNTVGTAPGLLFRRSDGGDVLVLPGVPAEMRAIMEEHGLGWIARRIEEGGYDVFAERVLVTSGIPESDLADRLESLRTTLPPSVELAFLPAGGIVRLRLRASGRPDEVKETLEKVSEAFISKLGEAVISTSNERLVEVLHRLCVTNGKTLAVAESCTGGMLGAEITSVPGSSAYFVGGLICYADAVKVHFGGVRPETLAIYGAVSQQTVEELASYVRTAYSTDLSIAISGIAGPGGGTAEKPVGTVWIAVADADGVHARRYQFGTDRQANRRRACDAAILMAIERLRST